MRPPVALSIAGSDPSGGAGIQADLKTFSALGAYGTTVLTALTAQSTTGVYGVHEVPSSFVAEQLRVLTDDVRVDAVKIGMLATAGTIDVVAAFLRVPPCDVVVLDPVMVATSGDLLLRPDAVHAMTELLPLVSLVTPNIPEAAALLATAPATSVDAMRDQARELVRRGARRVLLKGGHLDTGDEVVDVLADASGVECLRSPRIPTENTHGTGCSLSSAVAALRPRRGSWAEAVRDGRSWLQDALAGADVLDVGQGHGPVHHFVHLWDER
ncbi:MULTISPECIES: bifunctional hydroxymethylpyrimidine kinase/phosphomethylpyrimidine kinase [unclassified Curtobacterium]|uniref:bifunctional hydroxymethylpyrimidine kinase/phosphomethylpyrimidine kinase n=1 Tax=unclassified Curtobacterium TaxID=257496 RepID=UPI000DAA4A6C|nr:MULTISPECIES: bifunctional hydroxymethylpyrimidine kinase/phosphomethylpyrimidine kinase [unclassified Curtobacterium]PZE30045.1 bifunctional hydroxymethylpyrimidine kinase/phosphomethylpyrimidine kinase [Curtobacterium sp. MCBD17_028]WIE55745.1 bifunctional hydroxymethylpyrimidine kinase/phosphomethylpyrimidine kinase [Curtobacterium sp. MCBD17_003]